MRGWARWIEPPTLRRRRGGCSYFLLLSDLKHEWVDRDLLSLRQIHAFNFRDSDGGSRRAARGVRPGVVFPFLRRSASDEAAQQLLGPSQSLSRGGGGFSAAPG